MKEREFVKMLNLLNETENAPDVSEKVMHKIKQQRLLRIFAKSALAFPVMLFVAFQSVRILSETGILKLILSVVYVPRIFLSNPVLSVLAYVIGISAYASILISTYLEGGDIDGALLLPSR